MSAPRTIPDHLKNKVKELDNKHAGGSFSIQSFCTQLAADQALLNRLLNDEYFNNFIENNSNNNDLFERGLSHLFYQLDKSLLTYDNVMKIILVAQLSNLARGDDRVKQNFEYNFNSHFALRAPGESPLTDTPQNRKKLNDALDIQWQAIKNSKKIPNLPDKIPNNEGVLAMLNQHNPPKQQQAPRRNEIN